jgi:hypothetical protein
MAVHALTARGTYRVMSVFYKLFVAQVIFVTLRAGCITAHAGFQLMVRPEGEIVWIIALRVHLVAAGTRHDLSVLPMVIIARTLQ